MGGPEETRASREEEKQLQTVSEGPALLGMRLDRRPPSPREAGRGGSHNKGSGKQTAPFNRSPTESQTRTQPLHLNRGPKQGAPSAAYNYEIYEETEI